MRVFVKQEVIERLHGWGVCALVITVLLVQAVCSGLGLRTPWARPLANMLARTCLRLAAIPVTARGLDRLPCKTHLLVLNHSSFADPVALVALLPARPGYAFVTRRQFRSQVFLWPLLHGLGTLVLAHPSGSYVHNVEAIRERLAAGESLVVFPEGRIPAASGLVEFHSGVFHAAIEAGVAVVPACLKGTREVLPLGSWLPRRGEITLEIGQPIPPARHQSLSTEELSEAAAALAAAARGQILDMSKSAAPIEGPINDGQRGNARKSP